MSRGLGQDASDFQRLLLGVPSIVHKPSVNSATGLERQRIGVKLPTEDGRYGALIMALMPEKTSINVDINNIEEQISLIATDGTMCFTADQATGAILYANDPEMCRMMGRDDLSDREAARLTFDWLKDKEERGYALVLKETGKVIGNLTITLPPPYVVELRETAGKKGRSMSFSLSRQYQRQGLMEEALRAVIDHLFGVENMDYINLGHFDFNEASRALQQKLGFIYLATERFWDDGAEIVSIENILWQP
jgi:RimJ/RimL family protein N-acetyltransferase